MNQQRATTCLAGAMLFAMSCSIVPIGTNELPHVSAPPPALHSEGVETSAPLSEETVATVRRELERRRTGLAAEELDALARTVVTEARRHELDIALVMAVMHVESRYNSYAVSPVGALGIMQIMPATGKELAEKHDVLWMGVQTLFDPHVNVKLGVAYLKQLSDRYNDVDAALAAYNWGPGNIDRRLRRGRALPTEYPQLVSDARVASATPPRRS